MGLRLACLVCLVGFVGYWFINGVSSINWTLTIPLIAGAILASYPAAYATHKLPKKLLGIFVSITIIILGVTVLIKIL